ncbi:MAG: transaldolase, partial [Anaerolineales bacterium]|nr:transaldolase [Anaerolineales bacterium]
QLKTLVAEGADTNIIYEALVINDIQAACDHFIGLYETSGRSDGFVSLEVSPHLAHNTAGTIEEARRLYQTVNRPNVMIKVPATAEGIPAIETLISEGINVNITLMFNMSHYEAVSQAYLNGLQKLLADGGDPTKVASVASFFVSRVDTAVDAALEALNDPAAQELRGQTAIANAKVVYQRFQEIFYGDAKFEALRQAHAAPQRLLWASTSTKDPAYPDTLYVDELIGTETVNTMPPATMDAFRDHGTLGKTLTQDVAQAQQVLDSLQKLGIDLHAITEKLQEDGVVAFEESFDDLMNAIESKVQRLSGG